MKNDIVQQDSQTMQWQALPDENIIKVPTAAGNLFIRSFDHHGTAMVIITSEKTCSIPLVRFHSACIFGEALHALDCDCGVQLEVAKQRICSEGGVITYAWEEGRSTGIVNKIKAIYLEQIKGISTAEAFHLLGHPPEPRSFDNHVAALKSVFHGEAVRLASANPAKIKALEQGGFHIAERVQLDIPMNSEREQYLNQKRESLGHLYEHR